MRMTLSSYGKSILSLAVLAVFSIAEAVAPRVHISSHGSDDGTGTDLQLDVVLTVEHLPAPLGLDTIKPRFSWHTQLRASALNTAIPDADVVRGMQQVSYRLQVAGNETSLVSGEWLWDSGTVHSNASSLIEYGTYGGSSHALTPGRLFFVRVGVTYSDHLTQAHTGDTAPVFSPAARFSVAPTAVGGPGAGYRAKFIGLPQHPGADGPKFNQSLCPWLRKTFTLDVYDPAVDSALVAVASIGFHELWVNGKKAAEDVLSPSVSDLARRVLVRTYDVSPLLKYGENVVGLWLSSGWAGSILGGSCNLASVLMVY